MSISDAGNAFATILSLKNANANTTIISAAIINIMFFFIGFTTCACFLSVFKSYEFSI